MSVTVVPRFLTSIIGESELPLGERVWEDTRVLIPQEVRVWQNIFTDQVIEYKDSICVGKIFESFPVTLLFNLNL